MGPGYPGSDQPPGAPPAAPPPPPMGGPPPSPAGGPPPSPGYGYQAGGSGAPGMQINMQDFKATPGMIAIVVGAALLLLASLPILPWATATGFGQSTGITLDQTRSIPWLLMALVALVIGGAGVAYAFKVRPLTMAWIAAAIAAGLGLLLIIKVFLDIMSANAQAQSLNSLGGLLGSAGINTSVGIGPSLGIFVAFLGAVVAGVGAILAAMETGMLGSKKTSSAPGGYPSGPMSGPPMGGPPMSPPPGSPPPSPGP